MLNAPVESCTLKMTGVNLARLLFLSLCLRQPLDTHNVPVGASVRRVDCERVRGGVRQVAQSFATTLCKCCGRENRSECGCLCVHPRSSDSRTGLCVVSSREPNPSRTTAEDRGGRASTRLVQSRCPWDGRVATGCSNWPLARIKLLSRLIANCCSKSSSALRVRAAAASICFPRGQGSPAA